MLSIMACGIILGMTPACGVLSHPSGVSQSSDSSKATSSKSAKKPNQESSTPTSKVIGSNGKNSTPTRPKLSNIELKTDPVAARVPKLFYKYVEEGKYNQAGELLGPQLKFEAGLSFRKYLKNIKYVDFERIVDISANPGPINATYAKYYKIKVYYADMDVEVRNPKLVPNLQGPQSRRFILIKEKRNSPWLIDTDEDTETRT